MAKFVEENGNSYVEFNSVDEFLWNIWAIGSDYDGMNTSIKSMEELVDELVEYSKLARELLYDGKLFSKNPLVGGRPNDWKEIYE